MVHIFSSEYHSIIIKVVDNMEYFLQLDYKDNKIVYICPLFKTILNKMSDSIAQLKIGEKGIICDFAIDSIPLKLLEMGCLPGKEVELLQMAPLKDPLYIRVNGSHLAIRVETALKIAIVKI